MDCRYQVTRISAHLVSSHLISQFRATVLRSPEYQRLNGITKSTTIVTYHAVRYGCDYGNDEETRNFDDKIDSTTPEITQLNLLQDLQECIANWLEPLSDSALKGASAKALDNDKLCVKFLMTSFVCDSRELENLLAVNCSSTSPSPCHFWLLRQQYQQAIHLGA